MNSFYNTNKTIASILSFESDNLQLKQILSNEELDWDNIVSYASRHLILPTLYCRLKQKGLLNQIPKELTDYLSELTLINRNRNKSILNDISIISRLFQDNHINHVFLKGSALLAAGFYDDIGERMIGDIDILIHLDDIQDAFNVLLNNDYHSAEVSPLNIHLDHKHLPRLIPENGLAAIELHSRLFNTINIRTLESNDILITKQLVNTIYIPEPHILLKHNILNWQINDAGYYYSKIGYRSAYDTLLIQRKNRNITDFFEDSNKYIDNYLVINSLFFDDFSSATLLKTNSLKFRFLTFKFKNERFLTAHHKALKNISYLKTLLNRIYMFTINTEYRKDILTNKTYVSKILKGSKN